MAVTLTPAQRTALKAAVTAFKQASNQAAAAAANAAAKQDALATANEAVRGAALVDDGSGNLVLLDTFRIGAKVYRWQGGWLVETDDITDAT